MSGLIDPLADVLLTAYREGVSAWMETPDEALGGFTSVDYGFASAARAAVLAVADWLDAEGWTSSADALRAEVAPPPVFTQDEFVAGWLQQVAALTADDSPYTVAARDALIRLLREDKS